MVEQVICVDDSLPERGWWLGPAVVKNEIYTVRGRSGAGPDGRKGFLLYEVTTGTFRLSGGEVGYGTDRFAPIKDTETDISIFTEIDREVFEGMDA